MTEDKRKMHGEDRLSVFQCQGLMSVALHFQGSRYLFGSCGDKETGSEAENSHLHLPGKETRAGISEIRKGTGIRTSF